MVSNVESLLQTSTFTVQSHEVEDITIDNFSLVRSNEQCKLKVLIDAEMACTGLFTVNFSMDYLLGDKFLIDIGQDELIKDAIKSSSFYAVFGNSGRFFEDWEGDDTISALISSKDKGFIDWVQATATYCYSWSENDTYYAELTSASAGVVLCHFSNLVNVNDSERDELGNMMLAHMRDAAVKKMEAKS